MKQLRNIKPTIQRETFIFIFLILVVVLLFMPLFMTFNDVITRFVVSQSGYVWIREYVVPIIVRMVGLMLVPFGLQTSVMGEYLAIGKENPFLIEIAWNCIGWQSILFFILTGWVALQGDQYTTMSKIKAWLIGFMGTFIINLLRITIIALLSYYFGHRVAIAFHDYGSTLSVIAWLFFYWWFAYNVVLEEKNKGEYTKLDNDLIIPNTTKIL